MTDICENYSACLYHSKKNNLNLNLLWKTKNGYLYLINHPHKKCHNNTLYFENGEQCVNRIKRDCIYITGKSNSGKSYYCANYVKIFKKYFPNRKIYLFSRKIKDSSIDWVKPTRINLNEINEDITYDFFKNSLVIFDDILESMRGDLKKIILNLLDDILLLGRDKNIYVLITSHKSSNYKDTRNILNECSQYVIFPHGSSKKQIRYLLSEYVELNKNEIKKILNLPSRSVMIYNESPQCVFYNKGAYIL